MPQDDLDEIKEALLAARPEDGNENPIFYSKDDFISDTVKLETKEK
jgi:hypothetical protein